MPLLRSIFDIAGDLVNRQNILRNGTAQYGQDDTVYKLIEELREYLEITEGDAQRST